LSEARKLHLSIVLAHQFIAQISENGVRAAELGNCGTIIAFRIGAENAKVLGRAISAPENELMTISRGHAYVRTLRDGHPTLTRPRWNSAWDDSVAGQEHAGELRTPP
jgi:DNA helicase HerA-like ATPase